MLGHGHLSHLDATPYSACCCDLLLPCAPPCVGRSLAPRSRPSRGPPAPLTPDSSLLPVAHPTHTSLLASVVRRVAHSLSWRVPPTPSRSEPLVRLNQGRWWWWRSCTAAGAGAGGVRALPDPSPTTRIDRPRPFPPLCCKYMFQVFQMFQWYVPIVIYGYCKSR
jgi:hypothetical protein